MVRELDGHWGRRRDWNMAVDPLLSGPNADKLVAPFGNMQLSQFVEMIKLFWNDGNPEVKFVHHQDSHTYQRDVGYIVYSHTNTSPMDNDAKPRVHREGPDITILRQSFISIVKFSAVHSDPETADQIIEDFEDFMIECTPWVMAHGIQNLFYGARLSDDAQNRMGEDVSVRALQYKVITQKQLLYRTSRLEEIYGRLEIIASELSATPLTPEPPSDIVLWYQEADATPAMIWNAVP